jgi:hypothetical protein
MLLQLLLLMWQAMVSPQQDSTTVTHLVLAISGWALHMLALAEGLRTPSHWTCQVEVLLPCLACRCRHHQLLLLLLTVVLLDLEWYAAALLLEAGCH